MTKTSSLTTEQRKMHKQAVADRLADLQEAFIKPRKTPLKPSLRDAGTPADWRDPANSNGLVVGLARLAIERALHLSSADGYMALILAQTSGGHAIDGNTGEPISKDTATERQIQASRRMPKAERLLLRLVSASATRTLDGEAITIGARRKKPRKPHWQKKKLT